MFYLSCMPQYPQPAILCFSCQDKRFYQNRKQIKIFSQIISSFHMSLFIEQGCRQLAWPTWADVGPAQSFKVRLDLKTPSDHWRIRSAASVTSACLQPTAEDKNCIKQTAEWRSSILLPGSRSDGKTVQSSVNLALPGCLWTRTWMIRSFVRIISPDSAILWLGAARTNQGISR